MELDAKSVSSVLARKGITALYHANSVKTSCTFLSAGRLLSRGAVEQYGLKQTPQKSDEIDKKYGIWNDIFLDAVDIHATAKTCNWYGPVLFVLDLQLLKTLPTISVTRKDPLKWTDGDKPTDRFIQTVDELEATYVPGDFDKMFVIRCLGGSLPLRSVLQRIILDDPGVGQDNRLYREACDALQVAAMKSSFKQMDICLRACECNCHCQEAYRESIATIDMKFAC